MRVGDRPMRCLVLTVLVAAIASMPSVAQVGERTAPLRGLDEYVQVPESNPLTPAKVTLGRRLFFDPLLSADRTISCASCHHPELAFSDTTARSRGVRGQETTRNVPSILNRAYGASFFWDGRARSLEEAVVQPIENPREMALPLSILLDRLRQDSAYRHLFGEVFRDSVTAPNVARSLASYLRVLRSGDSPADRYMAGERSALSVEAARGLEVFFGKANCVACHAGPLFTDESFHNTGVSPADTGRGLVTHRAEDRGAFKVPSLRNVAMTAPYMHDGSIATLDSVVEFYDHGGGLSGRSDPELRPLRLTNEEKRELLAFLRSLTASSFVHQP